MNPALLTTSKESTLYGEARRLGLPNFTVRSIDEVPTKIAKTPSCGVVNLGTRASGGTHWVVWYSLPKVVYYYDSFGVSPDPRMVRFLKSRKVPVQANTTHHQDLDSQSCGAWSVAFLRHVHDGGDLVEFISEFHPRDQNYNERKLKSNS